jgi:CubicO group peptidase (beta-lactamase class C family)
LLECGLRGWLVHRAAIIEVVRALLRGTLAKLLCVLGLFAPLGALAAPGGDAADSKVATIESAILPAVEIAGRHLPTATLLERMRLLHVPGVSIVFIHDGTVQWTRTLGVATPDGRPVTATTRFHAAELSMPLTAFGALHEAQAHSLKLDADINSYLSSWHLPENAFTQTRKVTLRELLSHTAGITVRNFPGYGAGTPLPSLQQLLDGSPPAVNAAVEVDQVPGKFRYSSGGYEVVERLLEDSAHASFSQYMRNNIFGPLGMDHSGFDKPTADDAKASPFDAFGKPYPDGILIYPGQAAAGLWSTPSDIAKFMLEVQRAIAGRSKLISKDMAVEMMKPVPNTGFGLGLQIRADAHHPLFQFSAASQGFVSSFMAYEQGDGIVIMANGDNGGELIQELLRTVAVAYGWPDFRPATRKEVKVAPEILDKYVGYYRLGRYRSVQVRRFQDHLTMQLQQEVPRELFPMAEQVWFFPDDNEIINFDIGPDDRAKSITDHQNGLESSAIRTDEVTAKQLGTDLETKIRSNLPDPQAKQALVHYIDELQHGTPDYDEMDPSQAQTERANLPDYRAILKRVGALKNIAYKGVAPTGADIYTATFDKGSNQWTILVGSGGQIEKLTYGPNSGRP